MKSSSIGIRLLYWSPRVLTILFAIFISIFALDVFSEAKGFWQTALYLLLHLVPTALIIVILIISWRVEIIAAVIFLGLGILYIFSSLGRFPIITTFTIAGPLLLTGILFLLNWLMRKQIR